MASRRKSGKRPTKRVILIYGEGKSEKAYVDHVRRYCLPKRGTSRHNVVIRSDFPPHPDIETMIKKAENAVAVEEEYREYERVFVIVDWDEARKKPEVYNSFYNKNKYDNGELISCLRVHPCFEAWYLLHFKKTTRCFGNCNEVCKALKKHLRDYRKGNLTPDQFKKLWAKLNKAKCHSRFLEKHNQKNAVSDSSLFCDMHKLFEELQKHFCFDESIE